MNKDHDIACRIHAKDKVPTGTHGWIQWKGTEVCMDVHCACGHHSHIDADFFYFFECVKCGAKYSVGAHVSLHPLTDEEVAYARSGIGFKKDESRVLDPSQEAGTDVPAEGN